MDREEKQRIFEPLLRDFETETFAEYFRDMVAEIPDYIFTIPSSTSGKYHNATQCEKFGQIVTIDLQNYLLIIFTKKG